MHLDVKPHHLRSTKMLDPRLQTSDRRDLRVISQVSTRKVGTSTFMTKDCFTIVCRVHPNFGSRRTRRIKISISSMLRSQFIPSGLRQSSTTLVARARTATPTRSRPRRWYRPVGRRGDGRGDGRGVGLVIRARGVAGVVTSRARAIARHAGQTQAVRMSPGVA